MSIKLNGSNSGSVELDVLADAGLNTAITFPATSGEVIVSNTSGVINVQGDEVATNIISGDSIGKVQFNDGDGYTFADIEVQADANAGLGDYPGRLVFSTTADGNSSPTERMRITNEGYVFFNTTVVPTSSGYGSAFVQIGNTGSRRTALYQRSETTVYTSVQGFYNPNGGVGSISISGSSTSYNTSSDYRLKENIVPLSGAIDRLQQIPVHRFNFIADPNTVVDGFLAHEAQAVVPECVTGTKDEVDDEGNPVYQGIDQSKLVPLLTAALQEALQKIETQAGVITALDARLTALEGGAS